MYIVIGILMFGILIAVHELGHFTAAKLCGVKVNEFAVGMGPAIWKKQKGETLYALRILPIGGYCAMEGEDGDSEDDRAFTNQAVWKRFVILIAGSFMNFVMGLILIMLLYIGAVSFVSPAIDSFMDGCPYQSQEGLLPGDRFYSIDGERVYLVNDISDFLSKGDGTYDIVVIRDGQKVSLPAFELLPREYEGYEGLKYGFIFATEDATFGARLKYCWSSAMEFSRWVRLGLSELVSGGVSMKDMAGPVGIVDMMNDVGQQSESTRAGIDNMLYLSAFIAINLAIMNMLPIPALDGGRVFLLIVTAIFEAVSHKKLDPKYESYIHAAGMVLLLLLMVVIMFNDISRIIGA